MGRLVNNWFCFKFNKGEDVNFILNKCRGRFGKREIILSSSRKHGNSNNKSLLSTWSDDETQEVETVAFVSSLLPESDSDDAFSDDETTIRCKQLYKASKATLLKNKNLEREIKALKAEKEKLELKLRNTQTAWEQERNKFTDELTNLQGDKKFLTWKTERIELSNKIKVLELEVKGQHALNLNLLTENESLQVELKTTREKFTKFDINSGAVSKLFGSGKAPHATFGLGYSGESSKSTNFVKESQSNVEKIESSTDVIKEINTVLKDMNDRKPNHAQQVKVDQGTSTGQNRYPSSKTFIPTCRHCGKLGHIRPRCNERFIKPQSVQEKCIVESLQCELREQKELINKLTELFSTSNMQTAKEESVWIKKDTNKCFLTYADTVDATCLMTCVSTDEKSTHIEATCLVALTALADKRRDFWYVDSGCSRHMTGDKAWFSSFEDECTTGSVTFGDGRKASILARGIVNTPGIPNLKNVLYVKGLTTNLISVSHLANDYEDVCVVYHSDQLKKHLSYGTKGLGHVNYQDLLKLSSKQCVRGLPYSSNWKD
ncbi:uncharacterized protein LOC121052335 [Rosa chinensis]|uniref:uncharacterized protein LOC121052335 n=1 Tax=Rosa chinensis TaxID=74649 RepID=UPI001AD8C7BA|nr:uncharacterized protein LOC121052335 [Rosa chinensis]